MDFGVSNDLRMKIQENEKRDKHLKPAREPKSLWNMELTVKPNEIGALGTIPKGLEKGQEELEIRGWVETIKLQH